MTLLDRVFADPRWSLVKTLPEVSTSLTIGVSALMVVNLLLGVGLTVASGYLVGSVPEAVDIGLDSQPGQRLLVALVAVVLLFLLQQTLSPAQSLIASTLSRRLEQHLRARVMAASVGSERPLAMGHVEDDSLHDLISKAQGVALGQYTPAMALRGLDEVVGSRLQALLSAVLIGVFFEWWLGVGLFVVLFIVRIYMRRAIQKAVEVLGRTTPVLRRADYFVDLAIEAGPAKETRIFGLREWIVSRFRMHWISAMEKAWTERESGTRSTVIIVLVVQFAALVISFGLVGRAAVDGDISLAALAITAQAILSLTGEVFSFSRGEISLEYGSPAVPAVAEFENKASQYQLDNAREPGRVPKEEIRFQEVSFAYPRTGVEVLKSLDLVIPHGRSLAVVGENGAGKTTLIKLLGRLYDPTSGRILVDGIDLKDIEPEAWRSRIAVIFQDFVRYELSAVENVGFGAINRINNIASLTKAAERSGADRVVANLPHGWNTVLSRQYQKGTDISGGEWQRIALARAFMAVENGASVLVLDEPTASLDIQAEAEFFDRFLELSQGLTTILISHRFSTVRKAEMVCVLADGGLAEIGTHEELISLGGRYARMYKLQAASYAEGDPVNGGAL